MEPLKLIYFEECPNAAKMKAMLNELGLPFEEILQDTLERNDFYLSYTSPTLLAGHKIIFGESTGASCGACSLDLPSLAKLRSLLSH